MNKCISILKLAVPYESSCRIFKKIILYKIIKYNYINYISQFTYFSQCAVDFQQEGIEAQPRVIRPTLPGEDK